MLKIPEEIKNLFRENNNKLSKKRDIKLRFYGEKFQMIYPDDLLFPSDDLFPIDQEPIYVIDNAQIVSESLTITESLCESDGLTFGECNAAQLEITVADVLQDLTGLEFVATVEVGGYELMLGVYIVKSFVRQADRRKKKITAYNRMEKFQVDVAEWYQSLKFPLSLKEFRTSLCEYVGVEQVDVGLPLDNMPITKTIDPQQLSGIETLKAICELNGCFGRVE